MRRILFYSIFALVGVSITAIADVVNINAIDTANRFKANPDTYDMVDIYCDGKVPGNACTIPGNVFAGGGNGICRNYDSHDSGYINMTCQLKAYPSINRQMSKPKALNCPQEGNPNEKQASTEGNIICNGDEITQVDRFCSAKKINESCSVELNYQGVVEHFDGICKKNPELIPAPRGGYPSGKFIVSCSPPILPDQSLRRVGILQKLGQ